MAPRAGLAAPPTPPREAWPWHTAEWQALPSSALCGGDRRMEAETYLSSGYGLRKAIEARRGHWVPMSRMARAWMPSRLKGIQVGPDHGTPFLTAMQVFDLRPTPRKWLALARTHDAQDRFVRSGTILVTRSGSVGRPTVAYSVHENMLISDDLLRVEVGDTKDAGWLYAYLHSPQARAMMRGVEYGHIIKHLEPHHLEGLPVPRVDGERSSEFLRRFREVITLRNEGYRLTLEAEARFEAALGPLKVSDWGEYGFRVDTSCGVRGGRRRLDASFHSPGVAEIRCFLAKRGRGFVTISQAGYDVWLPSRFRRVSAAAGVALIESSALLQTNPEITKRIADLDFGDPYRGRVKPGWVLLARSGQVYGIIGTAVLATEALENLVVSDHVIRVAPRPGCVLPPGYLLVALSHPTLGRPIVKSLAYGSSVPSIDPGDLAEIPIVRLRTADELAIAELAEAGARAQAAADAVERSMAEDAGRIIRRLIAGT